ncbi:MULTISPECIES: endonuclease [unclassified Pseudoalteromonas]|uniref:endonuclease n=1 Tax=unclassified Pseudoalteromonas TaxID=194690 RepID=UPI000F6547BC|nr:MULTISPECIES: endonuclease [unclassified Pseudoalteromonas]RRS09552.1 endonuclease I [Pseudoalteromonas sp. J010]RXF04422.1 endonuclease I [Pseudoalteromonas sp. PS5]
MKHGKYKHLLIGSCCSLLSLNATAQVQNGSFESWSGQAPSGWTTIDSGITLSSVTSPVKDGNYAAAIQVNTATQSSTDLQQQVNVEAGKSYQFSAWVYHTEGGVKARLVVDGYHGYSDQFNVGQWQQINHTYTATATTTINVGLRFYDGSGFDGSETVYVDGFAPSNVTPEPPTSCQSNSLNLALITDNYASETSWKITNTAGSTMASGGNYSNNQSVNEGICLADGNYTFTILDSYGDGICCSNGSGQYTLTHGSKTIASGGQFTSRQDHSFSLGSTLPPPTGDGYYATTAGLSGYALKTELHRIIRNHQSQGYSAIWGFIDQSERDNYFEKDNSILDRYSEKPSVSDSITYVSTGSQCGTYRVEGDCYNREHSFPKSWFGGKVEPMNSDIHHIFASDGYVNSKRSNFPFGEVGSASYTSSNGSRVGSATGINYSGTVFEPIDAFKGDFARAYFYMATRYQDVIANWQNNTSYSDAVLNGSQDQVFETWVVNMLKRWHNEDPVDALEQARNQAAYEFQGNRNPFVDHPEFVEAIW